MDEMLDLVDLGAASKETKGDLNASCWDGIGMDLCNNEDDPMCFVDLERDCLAEDATKSR